MPEQRRIKAYLVESGLNQTEVADVLGISRESFNRKLNGEVRFTLEEAFKLSDFTGKSIEELFLRRKFTQK